MILLEFVLPAPLPHWSSVSAILLLLELVGKACRDFLSLKIRSREKSPPVLMPVPTEK